LSEIIVLEGNQNQEIAKAYQNSHFVVLPSVRGLPKAVCRRHVWGCVPVATSASCVPFYVDNGNSGIPLEMNLKMISDN
jgi:hypothetical protein